MLPCHHDQVRKGEVHASADTGEASDIPSADLIDLKDSIEHLGVLR